MQAANATAHLFLSIRLNLLGNLLRAGSCHGLRLILELETAANCSKSDLPVVVGHGPGFSTRFFRKQDLFLSSNSKWEAYFMPQHLTLRRDSLLRHALLRRR